MSTELWTEWQKAQARVDHTAEAVDEAICKWQIACLNLKLAIKAYRDSD